MNKVFTVHTMGRVGSRTISHSLFGQGYACLHTHNFNPTDNPYEETQKILLETYLGYNTELWVFCNVRDPVARNLSVYFHTAVERTANAFLTKYPFNAPELWFDKEAVGYWGADVFGTPFNKEVGWQVYGTNHPRAKLIVVQLERLTHQWPHIWAKISGGQGRVPILRRVGESHQPRYKQITVPADYLNKVYSGKVAQTFYSEEDLGAFWRKHAGT